jgi:hypothetical protein
MSDIFFLDESVTPPTKQVINHLKEDIFLNGKIVAEGTAYVVVEADDEV